MIAGSELFTGTAMYMPFAALQGSSTVLDVVLVWVVSWIGNLIGAVVLAALMHMAGGGVLLTGGSTVFFGIVQAKMSASRGGLFARGLLCNWLVFWRSGCAPEPTMTAPRSR